MGLGPGSVVFDRYRLEDELGSGGMGVVWRATDQLLGLTVALKRVRLGGLGTEQAQLSRERTMREARLTGKLRGHPHVVTVHDIVFGEDDVWLVLEYLPSRSLHDVLRAGGPLPTAEAARIGTRVADALAAAHSHGIAHRDVTPGNVLLGADGTVKLTDFGISHAASDPRLTQTGSVSGTLFYMAPEVAGTGRSTPASDLFSLGAMLYEAVEGMPPLGNDVNALVQLDRVRDGAVRPPSAGNPLAPILRQLLERDPDARPDAATTRDLLAQLAQLAQPNPAAGSTAGPVVDRPADPTGGRRSPASGTRPRPVAAIAVWAVALLLVVAGGVGLAAGVGDSTAPGQARPQDLTGVPPLPESVPAVRLTGDPRTADPCALVDLPWLRQFGQPRLTVGFRIENCQVRITTPDEGELYLDVYFDDPVDSVSDLDGDAQQLGELTRVRQPADSDDELPICQYTMVLADNSTVVVDGYSYDSEDTDLLCSLAEVAAANAINTLAREGITHSPERTENIVLAGSDACAVLDPAALGTVPGLDGNTRLPGFANRYCDYGTRNDGRPAVYVYVHVEDARHVPAGDVRTIAGKSVYVDVEEGFYNAQRCVAQVVYRSAATSTGATELIDVGVDAAEPSDVLCARATDLVGSALANLP